MNFRVDVNRINEPTRCSSFNGGKPFRRRSRFSTSFNRDVAESRRLFELKIFHADSKMNTSKIYFDDERARLES